MFMYFFFSPSPKPESPVDEISSQTDLHSDFFQNAVEKTFKQKPVVHGSVSVPQIVKIPKEVVSKTILSVPSANYSSMAINSKGATVVSPSGSVDNQGGSPKLDENRSGLITNFTQKV